MATTEVIFHDKLTSAVKSWTKSSIPNTYAHLWIKASLQSTRSSEMDELYCTFNGSSSGYDFQRLEMVGYSPGWVASRGQGSSSMNVRYIGGTTNNGYDSGAGFSTFEMWVPGYADTNLEQIASTQCSINFNTATSGHWWSSMEGWCWNTDAAIHTFKMECKTGDFAEHSCLTIYGIND